MMLMLLSWEANLLKDRKNQSPGRPCDKFDFPTMVGE